jgi:molybdenum cofactor biosynthesis protein A
MLYDNHGRPITYLRLAVTDRCNLRCFYCMPAEGINYLPRKDLLTYEEMERLISLMVSMGISKVRITGGEPFVRRDLVSFMKRLAKIEGLQTINLTTNGVLTGRYLADLQEIGVRSVNLSLDTLDRERFKTITRRDELSKVLKTLDGLQEAGIHTKINAVVMQGKNTQDLIPLTLLGKDRPIDVRFIEEMPFNGEGAHYAKLEWNFKRILEELEAHFPEMEAVENEPHATSRNYQIPGHLGKVGVIPAFSRTFCGTCNRIRLTAKGTLKTCLYDDGVLDIRALLRGGATDAEIEAALRKAFAQRPKNGFEAEQRRKNNRPVQESMSTIGG